jgi:hypothetical protein
MDENLLRRWCLEFDAINGFYPEHQYEGYAMWQFLRSKIHGTSYDDFDIRHDGDALEAWESEFSKGATG